jgi:hypothetical protein
VENPGLDSTDPRFDEIASLVQTGKDTEAAELSENILADGVYDIRLICYFLYGYWLNEGFSSLGMVIDCLNNAVMENWESIGPALKREKITQNSLGWLFRQILKKLQYEESKNSGQWQHWQESVTTDEVAEILELGQAFRLGISRQLENASGPVVDTWSKIEEWLRTFQRFAHRPPEPEAEQGQEQEQEEYLGGESDSGESDFDFAGKADSKPRTVLMSGGAGMEGSYHWNLLLKKLAAFDRLIQEQKYPLAAIVMDDINQTLATFDPRLYFPKTFEDFVRLQAINFEALAEYAEGRESPGWSAMQEWFRIDMDGFLDT